MSEAFRKAIISGACDGWAGQQNCELVDIRRGRETSASMNIEPPPVTAIAQALRLSRQQVYNIRRKHSLSLAEMADPEHLLGVLLREGNRSPLRSRLTAPAERRRIKLQLQP